MRIIHYVEGNDLFFNKNMTDYSTEENDEFYIGVKCVTAEIKFNIEAIKASAWRSKTSINIMIRDKDNNHEYRLTQKNLGGILKIINTPGDNIGIFEIKSTEITLVDYNCLGMKK